MHGHMNVKFESGKWLHQRCTGWSISCIRAIQPGSQHKESKEILSSTKQEVDEGEVILEDAVRVCGCQKDNDSSRQTPPPPSQFRQLVACVLGATWKVSRVEIEEQKKLLITSLETTWVASAHRVRTVGNLICKNRSA
jgi:hypothetical protein